MKKIFNLIPVIQPHEGGKPYDWGEKGPDSYIAQLLDLKDAKLDQPFSELWMGIHKEGPSTVESEGKTIFLSDFIAQNPIEILGESVAAKYDNSLPFLLKVLSAAEILSIQVHPNKEQALKLRLNDPSHYPDDNHKPELAIVLDELSVLAGLKSKEEIMQISSMYKELLDICDLSEFEKGPKNIFVKLIEKGMENPELVTTTNAKIASSLKQKSNLSAQDQIFLELFKTSPTDVGLLSVFLLNHYLLKENQAMYTPPGMPHAYVKGNIIEVMANSDMVIRVGPTPKFRDVAALDTVVTEIQPQIFEAASGNYIYHSPAQEFTIHKYELKAGETVQSVSSSARIMLVISGEVKICQETMHKGSSIFIPAPCGNLKIECQSDAKLFIVDTPIT